MSFRRLRISPSLLFVFYHFFLHGFRNLVLSVKVSVLFMVVCSGLVGYFDGLLGAGLSLYVKALTYFKPHVMINENSTDSFHDFSFLRPCFKEKQKNLSFCHVSHGPNGNSIREKGRASSYQLIRTSSI